MGKRSISPVPIPFPLLPHAHADDLYQLSLPLVFVRAVERSSCSPNSYEDCVIIIGMYVDYIHYRITKNFRDKKLSRNVTQQHFEKKSFVKEGLACATD